MATEVLAEFEKNGLVQHPVYNRVYVRALVRAYARELGLPPDELVQLYEQSVQGRYPGTVARTYLGLDVPEISNKDVEKETPVTEEAPARPSAKPLFKPFGHFTPSAEKKRWYFSPLSFALLIVFLAAISILLWLWIGSHIKSVPDGERPAAPTVEQHKSLRLQQVMPVINRPRMQQLIGDSLDVWVIARRGKLEPIRVQVDTGKVWFRPLGRPGAVYVLYPYRWTPLWIEKGDTLRIWARNQVRLRQYLQRAYIEVEGHPWPLNPETREIILTRERVQTFLDSLSRLAQGE